MKSFYSRQRGFSLVEVLVALSIFTIVIVTASAALLAMIDANKRAQNMEAVMSNLAFVMDSMTRDIRSGSSYFCQQGGNTTNAGSISNSLPTNNSGQQENNCAPGASGHRGFSFREGGTSLTSGCPTVRRIGFRMNPGAGSIERRICDGDGSGGNNQAADWQRLTSSDVVIDDLRFVVTGALDSDNLPPSVTIYIRGHVDGTGATRTEFSMQTSVTQQILDI